MADYPALLQRVGTTREITSGIRLTRASSGKPRFARFSTQDWYSFRVSHEVTTDQLDTLQAHYDVHRMLEFSFVYAATGESYLVQYGGPLRKQTLPGEDRWSVEVPLVGTARLPFGVAVLSLVTALTATGISSERRGAAALSAASALSVARRKDALRVITLSGVVTVSGARRKALLKTVAASCSSTVTCTGVKA
jgi:hypothetical protein